MPGLRARRRASTHEFAVPTAAARRRPGRPGAHRARRPDRPRAPRADLDRARSSSFVHPRTIGVPSTSTGLIRDLEGTPTRDLTSSDVAFHALREYQPGDERRYIHWKSTAKTGTYMVRQFEQTRRSHLVVAPEPRDRRLRQRGGVRARGERRRQPRRARDPRRPHGVGRRQHGHPRVRQAQGLRRRARSRPTRPARLLDDLAVVERSASALGIRDVARVAGRAARAASRSRSWSAARA